MINIQVICDLCGKKSEEFTPIEEEKTVKQVCQDSGFVVGVKRFYFNPPEDLCFKCYKLAAFPMRTQAIAADGP